MASIRGELPVIGAQETWNAMPASILSGADREWVRRMTPSGVGLKGEIPRVSYHGTMPRA